MRALLDAHAFLWWITDDSRLSLHAREIIADGRNDLFFSAASGWEIAIKANLGKVEVPDGLERFLTEQLFCNAIQVLPIYLSHALHVYTLPQHHRDPFDRLLVSQAVLERLTVLSADPQIAQYPVTSHGKTPEDPGQRNKRSVRRSTYAHPLPYNHYHVNISNVDISRDELY